MESTFSEVVGRREKKRRGPEQRAPPPPPGPSSRGSPGAPRGAPGPAAESAGGRGKGRKKRGGKAAAATTPAAPRAAAPPSKRTKARAPRAAAVVITLQPEAEKAGVTYAAVISEARQKIKLADLGITDLRPRNAATGARILEVPGEGSATKADLLAERLRSALGATVRVARPVKNAEFRVTGLDDSVTGEELTAALAEQGGCPVGAVRVGVIRPAASGIGSAWAACPVAAANKLAAAGRVMVGWVAARVTLLPPRVMQCHRCLEKGHTRQRCAAPVDRSGLCYRCGQPGHVAARCSAPPRCPLCADLGRPAGHRCGSGACAPPRKSRKGGGRGTAPPPAAAAPTASGAAAEEEGGTGGGRR